MPRSTSGVPGVVLEELARQFDRIPGDAVDAGDRRVGHARQHVVQAVAELVEQRDDVIVRQQRGLAVGRQRVADQIGHRQRSAAGESLAPTQSSIHAPLRLFGRA
jgi:hypothetical protein